MNNLSLLYAEDDEETLEDTLFFLDGCCPTIYTATDGVDALKIYNESKVDIILLDINMPNMSGLDVLREIRKKDDKTQVVLISANSDSQTFVKAINLGISGYIIKPYNPKELKEMITKIAEKKFAIDIVDENVLVVYSDKKGFITDASSAFCKLTQYCKDELIGKTYSLIYHEDMPREFYNSTLSQISSAKVWSGEIKHKRKDSSEYWLHTTITPILGVNNLISGYISVGHDITQKKEIQQLSITDSLSGLFNRAHFDNIIEKEISRSKRYDTYFSFIMIDIDFFKQYNDIYGHQSGDEVLKKVSDVLSSYTKREDDYAFRLGGEEFGILTIGLNEEKSIKITNMLIEGIRSLKIMHKGSAISDILTISAGLYSAKGSDVFDKDLIYLETDKALYKSKHNGRDMLSVVKGKNE
ncbi:MAG: diguanylate cyclase [Campylobacterota bacterium]|nr:diguanylate cyclase [Campylobacterota bacterium]